MKIWQKEFDNLLVRNIKNANEVYRLRELSELLEINNDNCRSIFSMRNIEGNLVISGALGHENMTASSITEWNGKIKLSTVPITKRSFQHKAKAILEIDADVLILQEVESRNSLMQLNDLYLSNNMTKPYKSVFHMAGNDCKGMGMGLLLKEGYFLKSIKTLANERDDNNDFKFENDLQLYKIEMKEGECFHILNCHFTQSEISDKYLASRRKNQLERVAEVYRSLRHEKYEHIIVAGTLNVPSYSEIISPVSERTDLRDSTKHDTFTTELDTGFDSKYYRMGAYGKGVNAQQKDYLMFSPALFAKVDKCGLNRKAVWPLTKPQWPVYDSIQNEKDAASEHPLIWADIKLEDMVRLIKKSA